MFSNSAGLGSENFGWEPQDRAERCSREQLYVNGFLHDDPVHVVGHELRHLVLSEMFSHEVGEQDGHEILKLPADDLGDGGCELGAVLAGPFLVALDLAAMAAVQHQLGTMCDQSEKPEENIPKAGSKSPHLQCALLGVICERTLATSLR